MLQKVKAFDKARLLRRNLKSDCGLETNIVVWRGGSRNFEGGYELEEMFILQKYTYESIAPANQCRPNNTVRITKNLGENLSPLASLGSSMAHGLRFSPKFLVMRTVLLGLHWLAGAILM